MSQWFARRQLPRGTSGVIEALPALVAAYPLAYSGKSRFTIRPVSLSLDQMLFLITAALLGIGLVMVQSAEMTIHSGVTQNWLAQAFANKNAAHALIAVLAMTAFWRMDYRKLAGKNLWRSPATYLAAVTVLLLALVLAHGVVLNGARRWLMVPLGFTRLSFQPSELAKWSLVLFIGAYCVHREKQLKSLFKGFLPLVGVFGLCALLVVKEDFGTTALIGMVCVVLLMMGGCKWWHIALLAPPMLAVVWYEMHSPFRMARLMAYRHPEADPRGVGYHPLQSLLTFASGGFWGRGLGNGIQKLGYLPEGETDFIFSVIGEELGFFGALVVVVLFMCLAVAGWRICGRCQDLFGKMVAFGVTAMIGLQAAINIAVVTVTVPTKGIALPLISSGGTGWIMTAAAIGILMSVERQNRRREYQEQSANRPVAPAWGFPVVVTPVEENTAPVQTLPDATRQAVRAVEVKNEIFAVDTLKIPPRVHAIPVVAAVRVEADRMEEQSETQATAGGMA